MKPVNNYVLVKKDKPLEKTESGLLLPTDRNARVTSGVIEECGSNVNAYVKKGLRVRFSDRVGVDIDDEYLVVKDTDILCVE